MKTVSCWDHLHPSGIRALTGEACSLGYLNPPLFHGLGPPEGPKLGPAQRERQETEGSYSVPAMPTINNAFRGAEHLVVTPVRCIMRVNPIAGMFVEITVQRLELTVHFDAEKSQVWQTTRSGCEFRNESSALTVGTNLRRKTRYGSRSIPSSSATHAWAKISNCDSSQRGLMCAAMPLIREDSLALVSLAQTAISKCRGRCLKCPRSSGRFSVLRHVENRTSWPR